MADRLAVLKLAHNALTGLPSTLALGTLRVLVKQTLKSAPKPKPENRNPKPVEPHPGHAPCAGEANRVCVLHKP